jgi:glycosyltransferase involved in cell wall biosynthesis
LAGVGPTEPLIRQLVVDLGIAGRVLMPGYVEDVWTWIKRADVLVSISLFEGRPNAVLESMACGCPLVVSDTPAHRELLGNDMACFVDPRNPKAVADALLDVLRDREAARRRVMCARRRVEEWSVRNVVREYDRVYRDVLARHAGGAQGYRG